jgi:glycosyltransferase involved in cell wall biosynthesis
VCSLLPSFSIVLETENLASSDLVGLVRSLNCLADQDLPPTEANEVLLIDSGDTPAELLAQLCLQYAWLKVVEAPSGTEYYESKMFGAKLATGDVVVYYDSDCLYESDWLRTILSPFSQPEIQIVAGETATRGVGIYSTAMAMVYIFPQFSGERNLKPTKQYYLNNVAFRQSFLLEHPIPTGLPLYRGNCVIHAHRLRAQGFTIWKEPKARTLHAPPNGVSHFFWRFLLIGHDYYWQKQFLPKTDDPTMQGVQGKLSVFRDRIGGLFVNQPLHILFFPLAIPVMIVAALLIYAGYLITKRKPNYLLKQYNRFIGEP